jgi:hypothetical protein
MTRMQLLVEAIKLRDANERAAAEIARITEANTELANKLADRAGHDCRAEGCRFPAECAAARFDSIEDYYAAIRGGSPSADDLRIAQIIEYLDTAADDTRRVEYQRGDPIAHSHSARTWIERAISALGELPR